MYVARILAKTVKRYFKHVEEQVPVRLQTKSLDQFTVLLKLKSTFKRITRLAAFSVFKNRQTLDLLVPKTRTGSSFYFRATSIFEISKQFQSWILNDVWLQTCAPTISLKFLTRNFSQILYFYWARFSVKCRINFSANFAKKKKLFIIAYSLKLEVNSGKIFLKPLFTEIAKNNCFSIYTRSDLDNIL